MTRLEFLQSLTDTVAEARYWVEVCYEDDCEAFREHAAAIIRQALRELPLLSSSSPTPLPPSDPSQDPYDAITRALGAAYGYIKVGAVRSADEALQVAIERLQAEIAKEGGRHGRQEVVAVSDTPATSGDAIAGDAQAQ